MASDVSLRQPLTLELNDSSYDGSPRCSLNMLIDPRGDHSLGAQSLKLQKFSGSESVSQLYEFKVDFTGDDLHTRLSPSGREWLAQQYSTHQQSTYSLDDLVGASCTVILGLAETKEQISNQYPQQRPAEFFNGIITSISMKDGGTYEAVLKPEMAKLGLQNHYRIFESMTIFEVIKSVLDDYRISWNWDNPNSIKGLAKYRRQDWVQSGETDLDFLQRLFHKAGLVFYFVHSFNHHQLIVTDQTLYQTITLEDGATQELFLFYTKTGQDRENQISNFSFDQHLMPDSVEVMLAEKEPVWLSEKNAEIKTEYRKEVKNPENKSDFRLRMNEIHMVSYGASQEELDTKAHKTELRLSSGTKSFSGSTSCPRLRCGHWFIVREAAEYDLIDKFNGSSSPGPGFLPIRPEVDGLSFAATAVSHNATVDGHYSNQFSAIQTTAFPGPYSPQGDQAGTIIGRVVRNDQIKKSEHFLPKSEFSVPTKSFSYHNSDVGTPKSYPQSSHPSTESSGQPGLFVELLTPGSRTKPRVHWVRLSPHMTSAPEEGAYVLIGKSSDETEVPEIQQVIEQKGSKNITREGKYSVSTNWGDSYNTSYGDSTRISLPKVSSSKFDKAKTLVESKRQGNRFADVSFSESKSSSFSLTTKSHSVSVTKDADDFDPYDYIDAEDAAAELAYVQYSKSLIFGNTKSKSSHQGDSFNESEGLGTSFSKSSQVTSISESDTATQISRSKLGVQASESDVGITNSISVVGVSSSVSTVGDSNSVSTVGLSASVSTVGNSTSMSMVGASESASEVGVSVSESLTGSSTNMSLTGVANNTSLTGSSMNTSITGDSFQLSMVGSSTSISMSGPSTNIQLAEGGVDIKNVPLTTEIILGADKIQVKAPGIETKIYDGIVLIL